MKRIILAASATGPDDMIALIKVTKELVETCERTMELCPEGYELTYNTQVMNENVIFVKRYSPIISKIFDLCSDGTVQDVTSLITEDTWNELYSTFSGNIYLFASKIFFFVELNDATNEYYESISLDLTDFKSIEPTHQVIDYTYHKDEPGYIACTGTLQECQDFVTKQNTVGYEIVPINKFD
jgi:hypothetical protein